MTVSGQPLMFHSSDKGPSPKSGTGISGAAPAPVGPPHSTEEIHEAEVLLAAENLLLPLPYWPFLQTETWALDSEVVIVRCPYEAQPEPHTVTGELCV